MKKRILIMLSCAALLTTLCGCGKQEVDISDMTMSASVVYNGDSWEVYKGNLDNKLIVLKNDTFNSEGTYSSDNLPIIVLPSVESSRDLDQSTSIGNNIYKISIVSALEYLNYLKETGYIVKLEAYTDSFYEVYLENKEGKFKRVIVTKNYIINYNTDSINFNIDDYIN